MDNKETQILNLYLSEQNLSQTEIARRLAVNQSHVSRVLHKHGLWRSSQYGKSRTIIIDLYLKSPTMSLTAIGKEVGLSRQRVHQIISDEGIGDQRPKTRMNSRHTNDQIQEAVSQYYDYAPVAKIAREFGVTATTILNWVKRFGSAGSRKRQHGRYGLVSRVLSDSPYANLKDESGFHHSMRARVAAIWLLGHKCERCGNKDLRVLQIDHRKDNGAEERKTLHQAQVYMRVLRCPEEYQVLCANCNWLKRWESTATYKWLEEIKPPSEVPQK